MFGTQSSSSSRFLDYDTRGLTRFRRSRNVSGGSYYPRSARRPRTYRSYARSRASGSSPAKEMAESLVLAQSLGKIAAKYPDMLGGVLRGPIGAGRFSSPSVEEKYFDAAIADTVMDGTGPVTSYLVPSTGAASLIAGPTQGAGANARLGSKIQLTNVTVNLELSTNTTGQTVPTDQMWRVVYIIDHQCNGSAPTVFGSDGIFSAATFPAMAVVNPATDARFTILSDRVYRIYAQAANNALTVAANFSHTFDPPLEVTYKNAGSGTANLVTNNVVGIIIPYFLDATTGRSNYRGHYQMRFMDA